MTAEQAVENHPDYPRVITDLDASERATVRTALDTITTVTGGRLVNGSIVLYNRTYYVVEIVRVRRNNTATYMYDLHAIGPDLTPLARESVVLVSNLSAEERAVLEAAIEDEYHVEKLRGDNVPDAFYSTIYVAGLDATDGASGDIYYNGSFYHLELTADIETE